VCRRCGALVGAGERDCMMCGASVREPSAERSEARPSAADHDTLRFVRAIITRPATFTFVFLIACVFLYLLMEFSGGARGETLIQYGAKVNALIDEGQWWRFVTPIFLHVTLSGFGPMHLLVNMYGLFMLGPYVEKLYGSAKFVVFWMVAGLAGDLFSYVTVHPELATGTLGSYLFKSYDAPGAGASGALFGLVGVLFVFGIKYRRELPEDFKRAFGFGLLPMILLNLFIGYIARGVIDNAAHLGGLVAGIALALFIGYKRPGEPPGAALAWRAAQMALLALVVVSFALAWRNFGGPAPNLERFRALNLFSQAGDSAYLEAINESGPSFDAALEGELEQAERVLKKLDAAPPLDEREKLLRGELKAILISAQQFGSRTPEERKQGPALEQKGQLVAAFEDWHNRYSQWIEAEGKNHNIEIKNREQEPNAGSQ
jgi:membrane associated rhomboid family serine protease